MITRWKECNLNFTVIVFTLQAYESVAEVEFLFITRRHKLLLSIDAKVNLFFFHIAGNCYPRCNFAVVVCYAVLWTVALLATGVILLTVYLP